MINWFKKIWSNYHTDNDLPKDRIVIASDVSERDGIGVQIYKNGELMIEIFRDDTDKTRMVRLFKEEVSLEFLEESIQIFKEEIPWDFIED